MQKGLQPMAYFALIKHKIIQNKKYQLGLILFLFCIISLFMLLPLWQTNSIFKGNDTKFHIERAEHWYQLLKEGNFFSYSNFHSFNRLGYPLDIFYPFITFFPVAIIRFFIHSPVYAYYIYLWGLNILTLWIAFSVGKIIWKKNLPAFIFTFAYFFSAYRLFDMYTRGAMGETIALTFLPLAIAGVYELTQKKRKGWLLLSISLTFSLYSHILSTLLIVATVFIIILFYLPQLFKKQSLLQLMAAVALFLSLGAIVIFPLLEQMSGGFLTTSYHPSLTSSQIPLGKFLENSLSNKMTSTGNFHIGLITLIGLIAGAAGFFMLKKFTKILFFIAIGFLLIDTTINVNILEHTLFAQIQFVWRLNSIISLFSAFILGELTFNLLGRNYQKFKSFVVIVLLSFLVIGNISGIQLTAKLQEMAKTISRYKNPLSDKNYDNFIGNSILPDYLTKEVDTYYKEINRKRLLISKEIKKATYHYAKNTLIFKISSKKEGEINTFIPYYKGIEVTSNNKNIPISLSKRGTICFKTKPGEYAYIVKYNWTKIQILSWIVTTVTWIVFFIYWLKKKRRREKTT